MTIHWLFVSLAALVANSGAGELKTRGVASDPLAWRPVPYGATTPTNGVSLDDRGLFKTAMENNIAYLLDSFSVNHMLAPFRQRAGMTNAPDDAPQVEFWDTDLRGSSAGRFLMGAGNTLRWIDNPELRGRMTALIDGIEACRETNGYILAFPPDKPRSEEPNYGRAWFTHGLIEASIAGNPKALGLLRGHADWFNRWDAMLPRLITWSGNSHQGHIASTRAFFTAAGKPEDLQVAEKYYVQDWWLDQLANREDKALWKYPLPTPHSYLITSFEAYLDHYRATGDKRYLDAMLGAWELVHDKWEHTGGSMAICEGPAGSFPPYSYFITAKGHTGETCGTVFWMFFNQRLHLLFPDIEKYVGEIEKSIYNVVLANQAGGNGIRYHAAMEGGKEAPKRSNTCCEGQGTRLYGALPEFIYSLSQDGISIDLFEASTIQWTRNGRKLRLRTATGFPFQQEVSISLEMPGTEQFKIHVRVPGWAMQSMPIFVNGKPVLTGHPGSYAVLDRAWADGDKIDFTLPMDWKLTRYTGFDRIAGHERYALEYGPVLLAATGPVDKTMGIRLLQSPLTFRDWLKPVSGQPLRFAVARQPEIQLMPYWAVNAETFSCYPVIEPAAIEGARIFLKSTQIKIETGITNAQIHYTLDGGEPTAQSPVYSKPFGIEASTQVKARLFLENEAQSDIVSEGFEKMELFAPSIHYKPGTQLVEMRLAPLFPEADIFYTLDGSEPSESSTRYAQPFVAPSAKTAIRARAIVPGQASSIAAGMIAGTEATPWPVPQVPISDLPALKATVGWNTIKPNSNIVGKVLMLGGRQYDKGMGVHAPSELVYAIKPEYKRFTALAGIDDDTQGKGSVAFEVYIDDRLAYRTPVLHPRELWRINVPIPGGSRKLRLILTDGGDDYNYDWGDWVLAGFGVNDL